MPLHIEYAKQVLKTYREKRDAAALSPLLLNPTTAGLRKACLNVYNERTGKGESIEENTLQAFFGVPPKGKNYGQVIEKHDPDKFRPLQSLIRDGIKKNPSEVMIEILAWLIDFQPRPWARAQLELDTIDEITEISVIIKKGSDEPQGTTNIDTGVIDTPIDPDGIKMGAAMDNPVDNINDGQGGIGKGSDSILMEPVAGDRQKRKKRTAIIILLVFGILSTGLFLGQNQQIRQTIFGESNNNKCMYWAEDHYEPVDCNEEPGGRNIVALDEERMNNFKKITREDTINEKSIGLVYYLITDGKMEYFTAAGNHPIYTWRYVRKLTRNMYESHTLKDRLAADSPASRKPNSFVNR